MADEFQGGVCGGNWWNSSRSMFGSSPCSSGIPALGNFGWPADFLDMKSKSSDDQSASANSTDPLVFQDLQNPNQPAPDSASNSSNLSVNATLQMFSIGLSSPTTADWERTLMEGSNGNSDEKNYQTILQEDHDSSTNCRQEKGVDDVSAHHIQEDWSNGHKNNFSTIVEAYSAINSFKPSENQPISSVPYGYSSPLSLQNLFDTESQPQQSLHKIRPINYLSTTRFQNEFSPSLPKSSLQNTSSLHFSTNDPNFCNGSSAALNDFRASFLPSAQSQFLSSAFTEKPNLPNLTAKANNDEVQGLVSVDKKISEPAFKRPRIQTPSPMPTFKVRKEKLVDRITALQQLVSPFGKTNTASVLHEAIEYIKLLHDQINVLSTPYLRNETSVQHQQTYDKVKDQEGSKKDLKSRGLCLVPISSTFPVAAENTTDLWTPTFGGTFR